MKKTGYSLIAFLLLSFSFSGKPKPEDPPTLAIGAKARSELMPQVPTLAEAGLPENLLVPASFSMAAPAGTPAAIVSRLNQALNRALTDAGVRERFAKMGLRVRGGSPDDMARSIAEDIEKFRALVKEAGIKAE